MKALTMGGVLSAALIVAGCVNTVRVYDGARENRRNKVPGVPFYVKKGVVKQSTVYRRSYYRVTVQVTDVTEPPAGTQAQRSERPRAPLVQNVSATDAGRRAIAALRQVLSGTTITEAQARAAFTALPVLDFANWPWETTPVSNSVAVSSEVDYGTPYYINARAPWFGSGTLNTEFAADGTITKSEATVEPGVAESIADLIPFKEFLSAEYIPVPAAPAGTGTQLQSFTIPPPPGPRAITWVRYTVNIEEMGELATFEMLLDADSRGGAVAPIPANFSSGQFTVRPLQAAAQGAAPGNTNAWTVTGSLTPPKPPAAGQ